MRFTLCAFAMLVVLAAVSACPQAACAFDMRAFIEESSSSGDRATGTPGCKKTADAIEDAFRSFFPDGDVGRMRFHVPVRQAGDVQLTVNDSETARIHPYFGNHLSPGATPPEGLAGPLHYVGRGELRDFNGIDPNGSVILMDLNSGKNWMNAASLGAKALIYIEAENRSVAPRSRFEDKLEPNPVDFPRFWMSREEACKAFCDIFSDKPARGGLTLVDRSARIRADIVWRSTPADNVYAFVPGSDPEQAEELIILEAPYDGETYVAGRSPAAGQAASAAALLKAAERFSQAPAKRSLLFVATAGSAQGLAGMREFVWSFKGGGRDMRRMQREYRARVKRINSTVDALQQPDPLALDDPEAMQFAFEALQERVKSRVEELSIRLGQLRLEAKTEADRREIDSIAEERLIFRRLSWLENTSQADEKARAALLKLASEALRLAEIAREEARANARALKSALDLGKIVKAGDIRAAVSLHLSAGGDGFGAFNDGWNYDLKPTINRTRFYSALDDALRDAAEKAGQDRSSGGLYADTLRPNRVTPWQSYLPDRPRLAGEVTALAGLPGITLATVNDARPLQGTPYDTADRVDYAYLERQFDGVLTLVRALADEKLPDPGIPKNGFSQLNGQANFLRQGELFPDKPAGGTVIMAFQGPTIFYHVMTDLDGSFRLAGLADRKHTVHKAILESFRFDPGNGRVVWAVDKRLTGKDAYRVKMLRRSMETELVMFSCSQTTIFNTLEPRSFRYMYRIDLIDGRNDAEPLKFWYSRLDTWFSTLTGVFLEPAARLKLSMSDTVLGRKLLLLNADDDDPAGNGFHAAETPIVRATTHQAASDMWRLLTPRIENLEKHGIVNDRIRDMRIKGMAALTDADAAKQGLEWDVFMDESRRALSLASRVYNDIDSTQRDVLVGVLFYVALFVPFAYCAERLFFGFVDIKKRIGGFLLILLSVIGVVYQVHPAFQLTYSPMVVILAFFIVGLSVLVSLIIFFRFETEMKELQRRSRRLQSGEGISKFKAMAAAFSIGVTNLRRRKVRTALTCVTLIILTFTIMNFTSVKSVREQGRMLYSKDAPYKGMLLRTMNWDTLPVETLSIIVNAFRDDGIVAPRIWYENEDRSNEAPVQVRSDASLERAAGMIGLSPKESEVSGLDKTLTAGRWFRPDDERAVLLPKGMGERLNASPGDVVRVWGMEMTVVGLFDGAELLNALDLDGEPLTPVTFPFESSALISESEYEEVETGEDVLSKQSRYQHIAGERTIITPADFLLSLGGRLKSMALKPHDEQAVEEKARKLADRFGLMIFSGDAAGTSLYYAADTLDYSGVPNIIIPLLISVLIVLNTMIGSVYERKGEIGVYTSVGLAPTHVSFLFVAEALAFAVLSVVVGYLMAQTAAGFLSGTALWSGMTANYSSLSGVAAMLLVIVVVLLSVIYPSRVAGRIAIPDVNRSWSMPEPEDGKMEIILPFLVKLSEQGCAGGFLLDYYQGHQDVTHGKFSTGDIGVDFACPIIPDRPVGFDCFVMTMRVWMAPFDFGVRQFVHLDLCPAQGYPDFLEVRVRLAREAGEEVVWNRLTKIFLQDLRKQLLVWRSLDEEARQTFEEQLKNSMTVAASGDRDDLTAEELAT